MPSTIPTRRRCAAGSDFRDPSRDPAVAPLTADPALLPPAPTHPRRLVYLGTPDAAVAPLRALHAAGFEIPLVVSRADAKRGRGSSRQPSPVKAAALELGLPVTDDLADVPGVGADLGVVVAYGRIIRVELLQQLPMVNLHFSLLPRWRGAAPVERAILAGDETTGVCLMVVAEGLDTGDVYTSVTVDIGPDESADHLRARLVAAGSTLVVEALQAGLTPPVPQIGVETYAAKIGPEDLHLDWERPAVELSRVVRIGGAWTTFRGKRLKVWAARLPDPPDVMYPTDATATRDSRSDSGPSRLAPGQLAGRTVGTGDGTLELLEVQPEGKGRQDADAWRNGARPTPDERLV